MQEHLPQTAESALDSRVPAGSRHPAVEFLRLMRPRQWTKNLIAYAPALFGSQLFHIDTFINATLSVISFCLASSSIYIVNDLLDSASDRLHPTKRNRPIASGAIGRPAALSASVVLSVLAVAIACSVNSGLAAVILLYIALMLAYSRWLKHVLLIDIFVIAAGFVLRVLSGAVACAIRPSGWLLLCTTFAALFISIEKRGHEIRLISNGAGGHRKTLGFYSPELLDKLQTVITSSLIMSYALYTYHSPHGQTMLLTVPIVLYAVMRYQFLSLNGDLTGAPEEALLRDTPLKLSVVIWALTCAAIIYKWIPALDLFK